MAATDEYRAESDPLADYLAARCLTGCVELRVTRAELQQDYLSWCTETGERHPLSKTSFYDQIRRLPGVSEREWRPAGQSVPARGFRGIGLSYVAAAASL